MRSFFFERKLLAGEHAIKDVARRIINATFYVGNLLGTLFSVHMPFALAERESFAARYALHLAFACHVNPLGLITREPHWQAGMLGPLVVCILVHLKAVRNKVSRILLCG